MAVVFSLFDGLVEKKSRARDETRRDERIRPCSWHDGLCGSSLDFFFFMIE
jgi:hypothetical protein